MNKTGVGRGVTDILKEWGLRFTGVVIHGGESTHHTDGAYHVPKKDLVAALEVPFDTGRLKIAKGLELWVCCEKSCRTSGASRTPKPLTSPSSIGARGITATWCCRAAWPAGTTAHPLRAGGAGMAPRLLPPKSLHERRCWPVRTGAMEAAACGVRRTLLLGTWVNKGKKKGKRANAIAQSPLAPSRIVRLLPF